MVRLKTTSDAKKDTDAKKDNDAKKDKVGFLKNAFVSKQTTVLGAALSELISWNEKQ